MMKRILQLLLDVRVLSVLGLAALAAFLFLGAEALQIGLVYAGVILGLLLLAWGIAWSIRRWRARRAARRLEQGIEGDLAKAERHAKAEDRAEIQAVRQRLLEAIRTIRTSRLGELSGSAALYELPWYMVIGNPAAGKSTAVAQSGLKFPFAAGKDNVIQGIGGTRNCDWFFTNEGILLDTAGRYSVHEEDRQEWLAFLAMLKKHRPKAPINGILIAASVAELVQARPDAVIRLARNLRQRVQELTETLEVFAPVYVMFTKADLISGFVEFFEDRDPQERQRAWGATLPYAPDDRVDAVAQFSGHFDELHEGLKQLALAHMSLHRGKALPPAVLAFPLEFAATKPALQAFVATLFEDNPYQYRPVFRGFYFSSAVQQGEASSRARNQVASEFGLSTRTEHTTAMVVAEHGFFLKDLFSRVIFADRQLVRQHASRAKQRLRLATFAAGAVGLALLLGAWTWSYVGNRQLVAGVRADLDTAVRLQADRTDLASRIEALELLQTRIEQLQAWRESRPLSVGLGLYQGETLERKLRAEYFQGIRRLMLEPVAQAIEGYLGEVNQHATQLQPTTRPPQSGAVSTTATAEAASAPAAMPSAVTSRFVEASPTNVEDAYKALKTYLMLAERQRMEASHLTDQLTRFWRVWLENNRGSMARDRLLRSAENMISFSMANLADPSFPVLDNNFGLVDRTRENLRRVVRGMPAVERVYADVKARASTRYAPMTVARIVGEKGKDSVGGSRVVVGAFTREAWEGFVESAFKEAAQNELQSADWVLNTSARDDLSLQGSPDQIRRTLTELYKADYVREWQGFMQGIAVTDFPDFDAAVAHMNRLGDPADSPIRRLMNTLFEQTTWDNPSLLNERLARTQRGFVEWFKQSILRMSPSRVEVKVDVNAGPAEIPMGPVGREFAALSRIMLARDNDPSLMDGYLQALGRIRTRFNQIKNQGDPGPAARAMMASTLDAGASELAEALRYVDEQMMTGLSDTARSALRPLLVRPLMQSFSVVVAPTETELNRLWQAQVLQPFQATLAGKYPFDARSKVEAAPQEVAKVFGPAGAIARFAGESLGPLVTRRGESITPRTWAEMGVRLRPEFAAGYASWVAPLEGAAGASAAEAAAAPAQASFQLLPAGAPGFVEYTIEIDGQVLRYRNGAPQWTNFVWPNAGAVPGARIVGHALDGSVVEVFNQPGGFGFERLIDAAHVRRLPDGVRELSWGVGLQAITVQYRAVTSPGATADARNGEAGGGGGSGLRGLALPALVAGPGSAS